jgi:hypothetical protein
MKKTDIPRILLLLFICGIIYNLIVFNEKIKKETGKVDLPEEFNEQTISRDKENPTILMAIYDTTKNKYIIEFIDK